MGDMSPRRPELDNTKGSDCEYMWYSHNELRVWYFSNRKKKRPLCLAGMFSCQWCLTLCDPVYWKSPGSSVNGIFQVRILEWSRNTFPTSRGLPKLEIEPRLSCVSCIGRWILYHCTTWRKRQWNIIITEPVILNLPSSSEGLTLFMLIAISCSYL